MLSVLLFKEEHKNKLSLFFFPQLLLLSDSVLECYCYSMSDTTKEIFNGEKNKAQKNLMDGAASQQAASSVHLGGAAPAITTGFSPLSTQHTGRRHGAPVCAYAQVLCSCTNLTPPRYLKQRKEGESTFLIHLCPKDSTNEVSQASALFRP